MRKSKAKPIIPPAAHQCPRKAAMVGNGKQHILEAILEKLQPAGVASWHVFLRNTDQVRMLARQEMLEQCNQSPTWKVCFTKETCGDIYLHHQHRHQHHQHHQHHQQQHHQHTDSPGHQLIGVSLQGTHLFSRASIQKTQIHAIRPVFPCIGQESVKTIRQS